MVIRYSDSILHRCCRALPAAAVAVIACVAGLRSTASAQSDARWVIHPALDINSYLYPGVSEATNNVQRLAEGDRYLYALITGNLYQEQTSARYYRDSPVVAARYDKRSSDLSMTPLATLLPTSGINVDAMEYHPASGCLALAYDNRAIDLIFDDGRLISNLDLQGINRPGGASVNALQFDIDGRRITAATDFGALIIDAATGKTLSMINLNTVVNCANLVGTDLIVADNKGVRRIPETDFYSDRPGIITLPAADYPVLKSDPTISESRLLAADGTLSLSFGIYPVSDTAFLFLGPNTASESVGLSLNLLSLPLPEDGSDLSDPSSSSDPSASSDKPEAALCRALSLMSSGTLFDQMGLRNDFTKFPREAALLSPTADGLMLHTHNTVFLIDMKPLKSGAVDISNLKKSIATVVTTIAKPTTSSPDPMTGRESYKPLTTRDGSNFFIFRPREGMQARHVDLSSGSPQWSDSGNIIRMNAPLSGLPSHIYYNPKHGMTVHNQGRNTANTTFVNNLTDGLSTYSGGRWSQNSLATLNPDCYFNGNDALMWSPAGGVHDPLNPDHIYVGSRTMGMRRQNLADPQDVLIFTRSNYIPQHPARIVIEEPQTGSSWSVLCSLGHPDFDTDGTMWTSYARIPSTDYPDEQGELWYWTAADRAAVKSPADYAAHPFRRIVIPGLRCSQFAQIHAPKMEANRNIVVHIGGDSEYHTFFYDHNGTPADTSDDSIRFLENALDENGERHVSFTNTNLFLEDPYDGAFIVSTIDGLISLTRQGIFDGDDVNFNWVTPLTLSGALAMDFGHGGVTGLTADADQRKWLTTSTGSLICLSADRSRILAEYTAENSPLPSANLLSVAYNPVGNSIFVGTDRGIAEIVLGGIDNPLSTPQAMATPRVIEPGYTGYLTFSGLLDSERYFLIFDGEDQAPEKSDGSDLADSSDTSDPSGSIALPAPKEGIIQIEAATLRRGIYRLADSRGVRPVEVIVI